MKACTTNDELALEPALVNDIVTRAVFRVKESSWAACRQFGWYRGRMHITLVPYSFKGREFFICAKRQAICAFLMNEEEF